MADDQVPYSRALAILRDGTLTWEQKIEKLLADPEAAKALTRRILSDLGGFLINLAKEVGIENPKEFSEYVGVLAAVANAMLLYSVSTSSERLETYSQGLMKAQETLAFWTKVLVGVTIVLAFLTLGLFLRSYLP